MIDRRLKEQLAIVSDRFRWLRLWQQLALCWLAAAAVAGLVWLASTISGELPRNAAPIVGLAAFVAGLFIVWRNSRARADEHWVAQRIEARYPDLNARLLAAIEQDRPFPSGRFGYLQEQVIRETLDHSRKHAWRETVPQRRIVTAQIAQFASLAALVAVLGGLAFASSRTPQPIVATQQSIQSADGTVYDVTIEPGDAEVERGTGLLVLARFKGPLPKDVTLQYGPTADELQPLALAKSLDDPLFGGRVAVVDADMVYRVEFAGQRTKDYRVTVFEYPELERADALLAFPSYTNLPEQTIEDTRQVTAVEGTQVTLKLHLNKPVVAGRLISAGAPVLELAETAEPNIYTTQLTLGKSRRYKLHLLDDKGRENKLPPELALNVVPNRPPELKLVFPGRDLQVSPLEEISLAATAWDDFGLKQYGLAYSIPGQAPREIVLGSDAPAKEKRDLKHLIALEELKAEPDQLLSYYFWAEDAGPDGKPRRVSGDMYFAEVRHFEEIFRQGQQPSESEQQQQEQQQQSQAGAQAEQMANDLKQIIQATWKVIRRETAAEPSDQFPADVTAIIEALAAVAEKSSSLGERVQDEQSKVHLQTAIEEIQKALAELNRAMDDNLAAPLMPALASEQAAYQALLKLRAREHEVVRRQQSRQQRQSQGQQGANRSQQQLDQLELKDEQNRYETQRQASDQQQDAARREQSQALNRLRELARRQQDLNEKLKELQSALEQAKTEQEKEEIRRQLKRLRDEQQEMLRDVDELRNRMDQPQNQSQMAEARQQLDQTRQNVRQASEALEQGQVPQALTSGTRAQRELEQLRDEFRQRTAGEFDQAMQEMRRDARELDQRQQELGHKLDEMNQTERRQLRDSGERQQVQEGLKEQGQRLSTLLDQMRQVTQEAETAEPLLSKQLYDTVRKADQQKLDQSLEATRQLLERGFAPEAAVAEEKAGQGISEVRQGVERAAQSVLGDEAESLRRAREEVDRLAEAVNREIQSRRQRDGENQPEGQQPEGQQRGEQQDRQSAGERSGQQRQQGEQQAGQQQSGQRQAGQRQPGDQQQGERLQQSGRQAGQQQQGNQQQQGSQGGQQGERQDGDRQQGGQGQQQRRDQQGNQQSGQQQGRQQQSGQQQSGQQQGERQQGQQSQPQQGGQQQQRGQQQQGERQQGGQPQQGAQQGQPQQGEQQQGGQPQPGQQQQSQQGVEPQQGSPSDQPREGQRGGNQRGGFERLFQQEQQGRTGPGGPITGEDYRDWSDRLRDVEEMLDDPALRADAARIRDEARSLRAEFKRHSKEPEWSLVEKMIAQPLAELRDRLNEELMKHESREALVPIDRDPVPRRYSDSVRKYYERLGSGN